MSYYCAVDLHGNNGLYGIVNETGQRIFKKRLPNSLSVVLMALESYLMVVFQTTHLINLQSSFLLLKKV